MKKLILILSLTVMAPSICMALCGGNTMAACEAASCSSAGQCFDCGGGAYYATSYETCRAHAPTSDNSGNGNDNESDNQSRKRKVKK